MDDDLDAMDDPTEDDLDDMDLDDDLTPDISGFDDDDDADETTTAAPTPPPTPPPSKHSRVRFSVVTFVCILAVVLAILGIHYFGKRIYRAARARRSGYESL